MALTELGGEAGDLIASLIAEAMNAGDYAEAERLRREAARMYDGIDPNLQDTKLGPSAAEGLRADPRARAARMAALEQLMQMGAEGGMDAQSRAALAEAQATSEQHEQAQRGALMAQAARRGMANSNLAMSQALAAQQGSASRLGMQGVRAAGDARSRALDAIAASGSLAGGIERDDFSQQMGVADRRDAISEFNARNSMRNREGNYDRMMGLQDRRHDSMEDLAMLPEERAARRSRTAKKVGRGVGSIAGAAGDAYMGGG
jgi:hypothetical protein